MRGEIGAVSIGYQVRDWKIFDADGDEVDPRNARYDDESLTFRAADWELLEASLCAVPADAQAVMRKHSEHEYLPQVIAHTAVRMQASYRNAALDILMPDYKVEHWSIFAVANIRARMQARQRMATR